MRSAYSGTDAGAVCQASKKTIARTFPTKGNPAISTCEPSPTHYCHSNNTITLASQAKLPRPTTPGFHLHVSNGHHQSSLLFESLIPGRSCRNLRVSCSRRKEQRPRSSALSREEKGPTQPLPPDSGDEIDRRARSAKKATSLIVGRGAKAVRSLAGGRWQGRRVSGEHRAGRRI